jgi:hypothetical protein
MCTECSHYYYTNEGATAAWWLFLGRITRKMPCKSTCSLGKLVADFAEVAEGPWLDLTAVKGAYVCTYEQGLFFEYL